MSQFPVALPVFTNLDPNTTLAANNHASRHNLIHDEVAAIAAKVGINSSAVTSSIDYKLNNHLTNVSNPHSVTKSQVGLANVDNLSLASILLSTYPVGAIYISVVNTNPGTLFGGTWVAFAVGRTLVGVDTAQAEFDTVEEVGGAKTHTLTLAEIPNATGTINLHGNENGTHVFSTGGVFGTSTYIGGKYQAGHAPTAGSESRGPILFDLGGGGGAHNNLQPYITVYMFKRTA